jgi:hypothetical protein
MCCGNSRTQFRPGTSTRPARFASSQPQFARPTGGTFENIGRTGLTVVGPVTGRRYHFDKPGSRVTVDPRDRSSVAAIRMLKPVALPPPRR